MYMFVKTTITCFNMSNIFHFLQTIILCVLKILFNQDSAGWKLQNNLWIKIKASSPMWDECKGFQNQISKRITSTYSAGRHHVFGKKL